jgi:hypothetical protein
MNHLHSAELPCHLFQFGVVLNYYGHARSLFQSFAEWYKSTYVQIMQDVMYLVVEDTVSFQLANTLVILL